MGTIADVTDVSRIFANTNVAAAAGVVVTMILMQTLYGKIDVTMVLNGALAGLVAITAEPLHPEMWQVLVIGGVGGAIVVFAVPMLDRFKIDDVVGAIPVHLLAGIWGTLIVPFSNPETSYGTQLIGVIAYGVFTVICSLIVWAILKAIIGIRVDEEDEAIGLDKAEVGVEAYPEFGMGRA
jgi:Amt family ammonium transporter